MQSKLRLSTLALMLAGLFTTTGAYAQPAAEPASFLEAVKAGKSLTNFRLRYEHVDQEEVGAITDEANALTLRSLVGWQTAPYKDFSIAAQLIDVTKFVDNYDERDQGQPQLSHANYPAIVDPDNTDINQLFIEWSGLKDTKFRLGRQSVKLDNVRFIGNIEFRQVMQVFDGVAVENRSFANTDIYLAHFERVKQVTTRHREGDLDIANIRYRISPTEALTGYGYFSNFKNPTVGPNSVLGPNTDQSNRSLGLRLDGSRKLAEPWKLLYTAEYAKQDDYSGGDDRINAHYVHLGAGAGYGDWFARLDHERLSSNDGQYAFQTPFGTNHLFQGWADLFLVTPVQGMRDSFLTFGGKLGKFQLLGEYHVFKSDESSIDYGKELDLAVAYSFSPKLTTKLEYANFREDDQLAGAARKPDTEKMWLTVMYTF